MSHASKCKWPIGHKTRQKSTCLVVAKVYNPRAVMYDNQLLFHEPQFYPIFFGKLMLLPLRTTMMQ